MTYCVGLQIDRGIVFASDTRTNAGLDNVASFRKMHIFDEMDDRTFVLLSSGNLAASQAVVALLREQIATGGKNGQSLANVKTMFQAARLVGAGLRTVGEINAETLNQSESFSSSFILGGQIKGDPMRLFQIYPEGNFIEATEDTPFFQIGEHKYGKPILDRVADRTMRMGEAAKLLLLSFDSTMRSNLSVGMPIDFCIYRRDTYHIGEVERIEADDPYFRALSEGWSEKLRAAFDEIKTYALKEGEG